MKGHNVGLPPREAVLDGANNWIPVYEEIDPVTDYASSILYRRRAYRHARPLEWEPFVDGPIDRHVADAAMVIRGLAGVDHEEAAALVEEMKGRGGITASVAAYKLMGDTINACENSTDMTLPQFQEYGRMAIYYCANDNPAAVEVMQRLLNEPNAYMAE